jgi:hypothetical protein
MGPRGLNRGLRIILKTKVVPQSSLPYYLNLDDRNLRLYMSFLIGLRLE